MLLSDLLLWIVAVSLYFFGDLLTTMKNIGAGMVELNPISSNIVALKVAVLLAGFAIYRKSGTKAVPLILIVLGCFAVLHNIFLT